MPAVVASSRLKPASLVQKRQKGRGKRESRGMNVPYRDVLKGDYSSRFLVGRELEVVQAVVVEDEPSSLPTLIPGMIILSEIHPRSQLEQIITKFMSPTCHPVSRASPPCQG